MAYFKIKTAVGGYRAYLYGANNEIVWHTETYVRRAGAEHAIQFARKYAATAPLR